MGLDIDVINERTGERREMNWLRNPFGLCNWAEANYFYVTKQDVPEHELLWYVINNWNYDTSEQVDKPLFLRVVQEYGNVLLALDTGYFWFDVGSFIGFVLPHLHRFPDGAVPDFAVTGDYGRITGAVFMEHGRQVGIPMDYLADPCFDLSTRTRPDRHTLARYQDWYRELIAFAELLQDPDSMYYCSN